MSDGRHRAAGTKVGTGTLEDREPPRDPLGTSVGAASGSTVGAVIGTAVGGPGLGTLVGAAIGTAAGALSGHEIAEGINPTAEDAYWRENYRTRPYMKTGSSYDEYQPAYRYGWESRGQYANRTWDQAESDLERGWDKAKGTSRLTWYEAKNAVRDAWNRVDKHGDSARFDSVGSHQPLRREVSASSATDAYSYEDYRSAYWYGWEAAQKFSGRRWTDLASDLERGWDQARGVSRLPWKEAEPAVREAWDQAYALRARPNVSLPAVSLQELHDPATGRLDAARVADYLRLPLKQLSEALGRNYSTVHRTPTAPSIQETLRSIKRSLEILEEVLGNRASVLAWWNSPHQDLGRSTPMQVLLEGRAQAIEDMLEASLEGIPS